MSRALLALVLVGGLMTDVDADQTITLPVPLTLDGRPLPDKLTHHELRARIDEHNKRNFHHELDELQQLNPRWLSLDEVLLLLARLPSLPPDSLARLRHTPLDLWAPGLKLRCADGFGRHGLAGAWELVLSDGAWRIAPDLDAADLAADLATATAAEARRKQLHDDARLKLMPLAPGTPEYPPAFHAEADAKLRLFAVQQAEQWLLEQLRPLVPAAGSVHGWTVARIDGERARLASALAGAPLGGGVGMPGSGPPGGGMPGGGMPGSR
jgi:hypothetical protein